MKQEATVMRGANGHNYVTRESVPAVFHCTDGNGKTGPAGNYNIAIEYTCDHRCECYKTGKCYACNGCYNYTSNQIQYSENYNYYRENSAETLAGKIIEYIDEKKLSLFRYFTCGDVPGPKFIDAAVLAAEKRPAVKFWFYTKRYHIVNSWVDVHGIDAIPNNLVIIFSHWLNDDGTYFPMNNPYKFPTSEFIPAGREELIETVTHICPCSNPDIVATCATCEHPCYSLKHGESMALLEHSTSRTRARDKAIKESKNALKAAAKKARK